MSRRKQGTAGEHSAQLTWAVQANGEPGHISEVKNGLQCGCACPACGSALIAKQGKKREHHFAHANGAECAHAVESGLHLAAKAVIEEHGQMVLPAVEIEFQHSAWRRVIKEERPYEVESVGVEQKLGAIIPDVIVRVRDRLLLVEVKVTHGVDDQKLKKIRDLGLSCVEVDLSDVDRDLSRENLKKLICDDSTNIRWVHNVRAHEERKKVLSAATLLESVERGMAVHADGCPIRARVWNGKPYANMVDDCVGCEYMITLDLNEGVICDGFRARGIAPPPGTAALRPPREAFEDAEEHPVKAAKRWAEGKRRSEADALTREQLEARVVNERADATAATGITATAAIRSHGPHKGGQRLLPRLQQRRSRSSQTRGRPLYSSYGEALKKWAEPTPALPKRRKKGGRTPRAVRRRGPL